MASLLLITTFGLSLIFNASQASARAPEPLVRSELSPASLTPIVRQFNTQNLPKHWVSQTASFLLASTKAYQSKLQTLFRHRSTLYCAIKAAHNLFESATYHAVDFSAEATNSFLSN